MFCHDCQGVFRHGIVDAQNFDLKRVEPQVLSGTYDPQDLAVGQISVRIIDLIGDQVKVPLIAFPFDQPESGLDREFLVELTDQRFAGVDLLGYQRAFTYGSTPSIGCVIAS